VEVEVEVGGVEVEVEVEGKAAAMVEERREHEGDKTITDNRGIRRRA